VVWQGSAGDRRPYADQPLLSLGMLAVPASVICTTVSKAEGVPVIRPEAGCQLLRSDFLDVCWCEGDFATAISQPPPDCSSSGQLPDCRRYGRNRGTAKPFFPTGMVPIERETSQSLISYLLWFCSEYRLSWLLSPFPGSAWERHACLEQARPQTKPRKLRMPV